MNNLVEVDRKKRVVKEYEIIKIRKKEVKKKMREMEEILGVNVMEREGRGIRIKSYGEVFMRNEGKEMKELRKGID